MLRVGGACVVCLLLAGSATRGQVVPAPGVAPRYTLQPPPPPVYPRVINALQAPHQPTPVPPALEIEILDPNVDPRGNPAVLTRPTAVVTNTGPEGRLLIDIPPTVLVHRYYYTGDRTFQAQFLPGGPSVVVVSHPRSGERVYVPVTMLPGAPRVTYTAKSIEYDYGTQSITISFPLLCCKPKVTYRQGRSVTEKVENVAVCARDATRRLLSRTGIPQATDALAAGTKNVFVTTVDRVNAVGEFVLAPPIVLLRSTPLGSLFTSSEEDREAQERDARVRRAEAQALRQGSTIRTNR
ncbi:MAG: hypothetical protein HYS12_00745 [Planctomycetes bacterium]|nr:hypothetical protein [Planctomycetota bacterium]